MGWDGSGNFDRTDGTRTGTQVWQDARDAGVKIVADDHDTHDQDIADGIENTVALDGQNTTTTDNAILRFDSGNTAFEGVPIAASELVGRSGSGDVRSLSAATVRSVIDALGATADKATSAQAVAGSANNVYMTPGRTTTHLTSRKASSAQATAGTDDTVYMTPAKSTDHLNANLAANDGTIPETDRANTFAAQQTINGKLLLGVTGTEGGEINMAADPDTANPDCIIDVNNSLFRIFPFGGGNDLQYNYVNGDLFLQGATGGDQGAGTLNAVGVYDDGTLLTDYVFDAELDGRIDTAKWDAAVPNREREKPDGSIVIEKRNHAPAHEFDLSELDPSAFAGKWRSSRKLPAFERLDKRVGADKKKGLGESLQALLETCEAQAVHIAKLEKRISDLESGS